MEGFKMNKGIKIFNSQYNIRVVETCEESRIKFNKEIKIGRGSTTSHDST
jgi:hypothetical protein